MVRSGGIAAGGEMTLAAWGALDEPGELVDGRLEEEEVADYAHELCVGWLLQVLRNWLVPRGGIAGGSEAKFAVSPRRGRKADVSVYLPGSRKPPRRGLVRTAPDILIEVITPTPRDRPRDRIAKTNEYAAFGVRWYWIIDPEDQSFEVFELREGVYARVLGAEGGKVKRVPGCRGLVLDLDALWKEIDALPAD